MKTESIPSDSPSNVSKLFQHSNGARIVFGVSCALVGLMLAFLSAWLAVQDLDAAEAIRAWPLLAAVALLLIVAAAVVLRRAAVVVVLSIALAAQPCMTSESPPLKKVTMLQAAISVAVVFFVGYHFARIIIDFSKRLPPVAEAPPKPPPAKTNAPPSQTSQRRLMGTLTATGHAWDISAFATNREWADPSGQYFTVFFTNQVQVSDDYAFKWSTGTFIINGWASTNWVETVLYDGAMQPLDTNLSPRSVDGQLDSHVTGKPQQFLRLR